MVDGHPVRAYLVLSADIHGRWAGGYHAWLGEDELGQGRYVIVEPVVTNYPDIKTTLRSLTRALRDEGPDW